MIYIDCIKGEKSNHSSRERLHLFRYHHLFLEQENEKLTLAVGIPYLSHKLFIKFLEPSKAAASDEGPNVGIPALPRAFDRPETRGASGPTTTSPTPHLRQKEITAALSEILRSGVHVASPELEIPAFPGAQKTASQDGDCFRA